MTQQNGQRQNREYRKNKVQRVRFVIEFLCRQRDWDEHQQPKQRIPSDLLKEQLHCKATVGITFLSLKGCQLLHARVATRYHP
jgi:hypothetical protein